ncbi:uncharacterized protein PAC_04684 [Phialocephala subalpina]|uniref:Uncharacterized protein n=1 Tax=Phialocephala subalpina TaxID=576137 RepID=A0A1L7WPU5_9HELO|nr:uncharacterized protein PAC_04684 [Phialocephala subalpina]
MSLFIDRDLQQTLGRILNRPLALSRSYPNRRRLILSILDDEIRVSDGIFTEIHRIMSTTTEIVAPATPSTVLSLCPESPQSFYVTPTKIDDKQAQVTINPHNKVEKVRAELEIATKEAEIYTLSKTLEKKLAVVQELEGESDYELKALEVKLAELKKEYEVMEGGLREAEGMKQNHVLAVHLSKDDGDKVNLRKAELEIMKMKSTMVEKEIEVMEAELEIKEHIAKKAGCNTKLVDAQVEVDALKQKLSELNKDVATAKSDFDEKYTAGFGTGSALGATVETNGDSPQVQALKEQIDHMKPLYWVGHGIRSRNLEFMAYKSKAGYRMDQAIVNEGLECYRYSKVVADAVMYLEICPCKRVLYDEFELFYGVPAEVIWEKRHFTIFTNLIGWKQDMVTLARAYKSESLKPALDKLLDKMYPSFELTCDADVNKDPELVKTYELVKKERQKAFATDNLGARDRRTNNRS